MIRFLTIFVTIWLPVFWASSQENIDKIKTWQEQNPNVRFVSYERHQLMTPQERKKLEEQEVIFFHDQIKLEDISQYESKQPKSELELHYTEQEVKDWNASHSQVKIIKRSTYENSTEATQQEYRECNYCLILNGEFLTLSDIHKFETERQ